MYNLIRLPIVLMQDEVFDGISIKVMERAIYLDISKITCQTEFEEEGLNC